MRKMYTTENKVLIYVLKSRLEAEGILTFIKNENPPLAGEIPPALAWPELWVMNDNDYPLAEKIIKSEVDQAAKESDWKCPECGEHLQKQFNVCWKCGHGKN